MTTNRPELIDQKGNEIKHTHRDNREVMEPFIKLSLRAIKEIGLCLIAILSALPLLMPRRHDTAVKRS